MKSGQWHFYQDNAPVHNCILVTDYLTKMGIKTVAQPPYSPDLAPCDFSLFPKLRGCCYETIEEMKEAVLRSLTRSHKRISTGPSRSCWNGTTSALQLEEISSKGTSFMCVLLIKVPIWKKSAPCIFVSCWHCKEYSNSFVNFASFYFFRLKFFFFFFFFFLMNFHYFYKFISESSFGKYLDNLYD